MGLTENGRKQTEAYVILQKPAVEEQRHGVAGREWDQVKAFYGVKNNKFVCDGNDIVESNESFMSK